VVGAADVQAAGRQGPWTMLKVKGFQAQQPTRLRALPTPQGVRAVQETLVLDGLRSSSPLAVRELVDAQNGKVLVREDLVDHETDQTTDQPDPRWAAFPAIAPRPVAPTLIMRSFDIPDVKASFLRLRVVTNQCTGSPAFRGDQDNDPGNITDCVQGSPQGSIVRASELQVFHE
jgi:hypothetical protein